MSQGKSIAFHLSWLPDTIVNDPTEEDEAVDFSKDGEARDTSVKAERFFTRWLSSLDLKNEAELEASFESAWDELSLTAEEEDKFVDNFITRATNWDALLDTAGAPTDGIPPDPLESQRLAEQMGIPSLEEMSQGGGMGPGSAGGTPGVTSPVPSVSPAPPGAQDKAAQKRRAGRGVEGDGADLEMTGPANPIDPSNSFDWDNLPIPGLPGNGY